jgi:hypothetical protein
MTFVTPQRVAIGKAIIALFLITLILAGTLVLFLVAATTTTTTATKTISTSLNTTTKTILGAESQCEFTQTCATTSASGLELILSVNTTTVMPNGTVSVSVTELNTLSTTNNVSSSSEWRLPLLTWTCGVGYYPNGIELFKGYYTLGNLTSASPLPFWATIECPASDLSSVASYAFQPNSDNASYYANYYSYSECNPPNCVVQTSSLVLGDFPPTSMFAVIEIEATNIMNNIGYNQLNSSAPSNYTLVAGDEWGGLVLMHFSVT